MCNSNLELQARWSQYKQWGRVRGEVSFENLYEKTNIENKWAEVLSHEVRKCKLVSPNNQEEKNGDSNWRIQLH